jgi:hypothetical protein
MRGTEVGYPNRPSPPNNRAAAQILQDNGHAAASKLAKRLSVLDAVKATELLPG